MTHNDEDYISLTDMVSSFEGGSALIEAWLRNKDTVEFLGVWEKLNNPDFNLSSASFF
ncbi:KilA-N domain-containing protein [Beggiatoa alba]|uniref:KilA-N domain-containing protein n=1 Tax=Beggiatoa alba TaxID=1022 RepID=UPI0022B70157|nr:KilA-N domain-containing protein [Beggiatoa alba]